MPSGYGISGADDPAVARTLADLSTPQSDKPDDLAFAAAGAVVALATSAGKALDLAAPVPQASDEATVPHANAATSSGALDTTTIALIVGGSIGLLGAIVGLIWWMRQAPDELDAEV